MVPPCSTTKRPWIVRPPGEVHRLAEVADDRLEGDCRRCVRGRGAAVGGAEPRRVALGTGALAAPRWRSADRPAAATTRDRHRERRCEQAAGATPSMHAPKGTGMRAPISPAARALLRPAGG